MNFICKKEAECRKLQSEMDRHRRARQLAIFEINRIKTSTRKMKPGQIPSGDAQRWLTKVNKLLTI